MKHSKKSTTQPQRISFPGKKPKQQNSSQTGTGFTSIPNSKSVEVKLSRFSFGSTKPSSTQKRLVGKTMRTTVYAIIILIIIGGYSVFFLSNLFLPKILELHVSEIGQPVSFSDSNKRTATVARWDYSPKQGIAEAEIDLKNETYDGKTEYHVSCFSVQDETVVIVDPTIMVQKNNLLIVQFPVYKNFTELLVRIDMDVSDSEDSESVISTAMLFTNKNSVNRVDVIESKTETDYLVSRLQKTIDGYKKERKALLKAIEKNNDTIQNINTLNAQLQEDKVYQTEAEIEDTDQKINQNNQQITRLKDENTDLQKSVANYDRLIESSEKKYNSLSAKK